GGAGQTSAPVPGSNKPTDMSTPSTGGPTGMTSTPAPANAGRLRLLTRSQFENSLRDLLGAGVTVAATEGDVIADAFASVGATYTTVSPRGVEQYETAILGALDPLFADAARRAALLGCDPNEACVRRFITDFGKRAWRRPLTTAEVERYSQLAIS